MIPKPVKEWNKLIQKYLFFYRDVFLNYLIYQTVREQW
jgi:hypothetical protein